MGRRVRWLVVVLPVLALCGACRFGGGPTPVSSTPLVAVDMDAARYRFITELGGDVLQADDPAALEAAVKKIYEGKILAEAMDAEAGEEAPETAAPAPTPSTGSAK